MANSVETAVHFVAMDGWMDGYGMLQLSHTAILLCERILALLLCLSSVERDLCVRWGFIFLVVNCLHEVSLRMPSNQVLVSCSWNNLLHLHGQNTA